MSRKLSDSLLPDKKLISSSFDISNMLFGVSTRPPPLPRATTFGSALQLDSLDWLVVALLVMAVLLMLPPLGGLLSCFMTTTTVDGGCNDTQNDRDGNVIIIIVAGDCPVSSGLDNDMGFDQQRTGHRWC